jgi:fatty acid desaturase
MSIEKRSVTAAELQRAVADLQETRPARGLFKVAYLTVAIGIFFSLAMSTESTLLFVVFSIITSFLFAAYTFLTHDAIHTTLTGIKWFDEVWPRLVAIPLVWSHGLYSELHKIHHKMNGTDAQDPERCQWTAAEYEAATPLKKWYYRNQIWLNIFVFGGWGMLIKTVAQGIKFSKRSRAVKRQLIIDTVLLVVGNAAIIIACLQMGVAGRYFIFWLFFLERIVGAINQFRTHIEHYGLWGHRRNYFETQIFASRNIKTSAFGSWFFNGLNFHSMHHAFARIPFYNLKEAHYRIMELCKESDGPMVEEEGYVKSMLRAMSEPRVIAAKVGEKKVVAAPDVQPVGNFATAK